MVAGNRFDGLPTPLPSDLQSVSLETSGPVTIGADLTVAGGASIAGPLTVAGVPIDGSLADPLTLTQFHATELLQSDGIVRAQGKLEVGGGAAIVGDVGIEGDTTVTGILDVTGEVRLNGEPLVVPPPLPTNPFTVHSLQTVALQTCHICAHPLSSGYITLAESIRSTDPLVGYFGPITTEDITIQASGYVTSPAVARFQASELAPLRPLIDINGPVFLREQPSFEGVSPPQYFEIRACTRDPFPVIHNAEKPPTRVLTAGIAFFYRGGTLGLDDIGGFYIDREGVVALASGQ